MIFDLAPVAHGVSSDIAYSCTFGVNRVFDELDAGLAQIRTFLQEGIRAGESMLTLYQELDDLVARRGWEICNHRYADGALGHLVFPLEHEPDRPSPLPGWGTAAAEKLLATGIAALDEGPVTRCGTTARSAITRPRLACGLSSRTSHATGSAPSSRSCSS